MEKERLVDKLNEAGASYIVQKNFTYEDYVQLPEEPGYRYEVIDGILVKEPSPVIRHQLVSNQLQRVLQDYFALVNPQGEVLNAPLDTILSNDTVVQPDLIYIADIKRLANSNFIDIVPDLVVEVLSPSTARKDQIRKHELYRRHQIQHYWIVDPEGTIEAYRLQDTNYLLVIATDQDFEHPDFPGLCFTLQKVCHDPTK